MASYDPRVINAFNRALAKTKAPPVVRKALFEAGYVESGLRNLDYGDRDSLGALQQRPSQGWRHATDPYLGAIDFIHAADRTLSSGFHGSPGALAQAVQRSAYPARYDAAAGKVSSLLGHPNLAATSPGGRHQGLITPGSGSDTGAGAQSPAPSLTDPGQASDFTGLLSSLLQHRQPQAQMSPIAPPSFAAAPKLAQGTQPLDPSAPAQAQGPSVSDLLSAISASGGSSPQLSPGQIAGNAENGPSVPPGQRDTTATGHASTGFHGSKVLELIHNDGAGRPGFGIKNGQTVNGSQVFSDVWAGHANHVHVAAGPKTVVALGKLAQSMGLHVGENPHFGGVDPGAHVPGSYHDIGEAIDVSGAPRLMDAFARAVAKYNRTRTIPT